jgi:uncharacterized protein (DUF885 family)
MKLFPALLLLALVLSASAQQPAPNSVAANRAALNSLLDEMWQDNLSHSPEFASSIGDLRYNDQLTDYSVKAERESLARGQQYLLRLATISTDGLTDQEKLSVELITRELTNDQEGARFKPWQMPVNQFWGIHTTLPAMVTNLRFETVKDYEDWIARLNAIPRVLEQATENMAAGVDERRVPPAFLLEKVVAQTKAIADHKPEDSPFAIPLTKFPASISAADQARLRDAMLTAITEKVLPAYKRFAGYLEKSYLPAGRKEPGAWALPDGDAYYAFCIRESTTTDLTADQIHQIGLDEVKRDEAAMLVIAQSLGYKDLKSFQQAVKNNPKLHPASKEALLAAYRHYEDQMQAKLPTLFGRLPKAKLEVVAMPAFVEHDQAAAYYDQGTPDGSRPGHVTVNTYKATERSLADVEAVAYHEGIPGHHLQISIAQELTGIPEFRKHLGYTAYVEGWALYAERLGKDVGYYQDPYSDYGRLEADIWRAIRLVVDTGVHSRHWTREQMVQYFRDHSAIDETNINAEVDRYIGWPGQALGYKIGQLKILELRDRSKKQLGDKFDIRAFHDQIVGAGALPLDLLDERINQWITEQIAAKK